MNDIHSFIENADKKCPDIFQMTTTEDNKYTVSVKI